MRVLLLLHSQVAIAMCLQRLQPEAGLTEELRVALARPAKLPEVPARLLIGLEVDHAPVASQNGFNKNSESAIFF